MKQVTDVKERQVIDKSKENEFADLLFIEDSSVKNELPSDFVEICRRNVGKKIRIENVAKKLNKKVPSKKNIHSFVWQLNNSLLDSEIFRFGYSTREGLFLTIKSK